MNTYSLNGFGEHIAAARKAKGITQDELAAKLSITPQAISKWERGTGLPDISIFPSLAEALGASVGELFGEKAKETQTIPATYNGLPLVAREDNIGCYSDKAVLSVGEGSVEFTDGSTADYATQTVINKGAGDVFLREVSGLLSLDINGSGKIKGGGKADNLWITCNGSGKIDLRQLEARNARIDLGGSAEVTVGRITSQSVERISNKSTLNVLERK